MANDDQGLSTCQRVLSRFVRWLKNVKVRTWTSCRRCCKLEEDICFLWFSLSLVSVLSLFLYNPLSCTVLNNINSLFLFSSREYFLLYKIIIYLTSVYHFLAKKIICRNLSQFTTKFFWISFVPCDMIPLFLRKANCAAICIIFSPCTRLKVKMRAQCSSLKVTLLWLSSI